MHNARSHRWENIYRHQIEPLISEMCAAIEAHASCFFARKVQVEHGAVISVLEIEPDSIFFDRATRQLFLRVGGFGGAKSEPSYAIVRRTDFLDRKVLDRREEFWGAILFHACRQAAVGQ